MKLQCVNYSSVKTCRGCNSRFIAHSPNTKLCKSCREGTKGSDRKSRWRKKADRKSWDKKLVSAGKKRSRNVKAYGKAMLVIPKSL